MSNPLDQFVTLKDVAQKAEVSVMTASRALRNAPGVSQSTRERVLEIARTLGYRPNALVSAYQSYVRSHRTNFKANIAWVNDHTSRGYWHKGPYLEDYVKAAAARCDRLGYRLEEVWLPRSERGGAVDGWRAYQRVLRARGIRGVILPHLLHPTWATFDWDGFSVATIGSPHRFLQEAQCQGAEDLYHVSTMDAFSNARRALEQLRRRGYKRIGFFLPRWLDQFSDTLYRASFRIMQEEQGGDAGIPILMDDDLSEKVPRFFEDWVRANRPEVILCSKNIVLPWVRQMGLRVPEDICLAHLFLASDVAGWTGIDPRKEAIAEAAVDLVVGQLQQGEFGPVVAQRKVLTEGVWVDGWTAPARCSKSRRR